MKEKQLTFKAVWKSLFYIGFLHFKSIPCISNLNFNFWSQLVCFDAMGHSLPIFYPWFSILHLRYHFDPVTCLSSCLSYDSLLPGQALQLLLLSDLPESLVSCPRWPRWSSAWRRERTSHPVVVLLNHQSPVEIKYKYFNVFW